MKSLAIALAGTAVLAVQSAAQVKDTTVRLDALVAMIGNTPITVYDIERRLADSVSSYMQTRRPMPSKEVQAAMVKATLNEIVEEEVLLYKAKDAGIEVSDATVTSIVDSEMRRQTARFPNQAQFRQALEQAGLGSPEEFRRTLMTNVRRSETIREFVQSLRSDPSKKIPSVVVPESQVRGEYDRLKASGQLMRRAYMVGWRQMVIAPQPSAAAKAAARAKIDSLRNEIRAEGGDFERIAKRESMDPGSKDLGGDLGWRKRGDLAIELEVLMFGPRALRQGDVSPVIESPFGFHLLRIDRANPPAEVKARHILIIPKIDSADVERARVLADSLAGAIRRGAVFDSIARVFHDRAEDAPGLIPEQPIDSLPASYQAGLKDVKKDSVVSFAIPSGMGHSKFVIAVVSSTSEPGDYSYEQISQQIRFQLQNVGQMRKYIDEQKKSVYVRTYPDRALEAGRIFDLAPVPVTNRPPGPPGQ